MGSKGAEKKNGIKRDETQTHTQSSFLIVVAYRCACASTFPSNDLNKQFPLSLSISGYKNSIFLKWKGKNRRRSFSTLNARRTEYV